MPRHSTTTGRQGKAQKLAPGKESNGPFKTLDELAEESPKLTRLQNKEKIKAAKDRVVPKEFMALAHRYRADHDDDLKHWRSDFYSWNGQGWRLLDSEELRARLYVWLEDKLTVPSLKSTALVPFDPNKTKVANLIEALAAVGQLPVQQEPPFWIDQRKDDPDPADLLPFRNGVLNLRTGQRRDPDRRLFALHRVECDHDPDAEAPRWERFLAEIFPEDQDSRDTLEEALGYTLTANRSFQKIFALIGVRRSGKGTIARVMAQLKGDLYVGPTVSSFASNFGLQQLIGKSVAVVADARDDDHTGPKVIVERLLTVSGQDKISADRKHRSHWSGTLPTVIWWMSNVLPKFRDSSGTIVSRLVLLFFEVSFEGKEDLALSNQLYEELPGIVNRALEGYRRLRARGYFKQPATGQSMLSQLEHAADPVIAWLDEKCTKGADLQVRTTAAFSSFQDWCDGNGHHKPSTTELGRRLRALVPSFDMKKRGSKGAQVYYYRGFGLNEETLDYGMSERERERQEREIRVVPIRGSREF